MGAPAPTGDLRAYTRAKAQSLGIDPDIAERVAESEGGFDDPVRQSDVISPITGRREQSFGPFQMNIDGGLGAESIRRGFDPRDPANVYRNIDFALENARENGWAINGIVALYAATGDAQYLQAAVRAADWIEKNRSLPGGGFSHDEQSKDAAGGLYLGDTLFMGRAFLSLYTATGDRSWLKKAEQAADFMGEHFQARASGQAGFATADLKGNHVHAP